MPATATNLKKELLDLEKQNWEATKNQDKRKLEELTANEFTFVMGEGITSFDRRGFVEMMTKGDFKITSYSFDEAGATFRELSPDVALLSYKSHMEYEQGGKQNQADSYITSIWVREGRNWKTAVATDTPITTGS